MKKHNTKKDAISRLRHKRKSAKLSNSQNITIGSTGIKKPQLK